MRKLKAFAELLEIVFAAAILKSFLEYLSTNILFAHS
jgi:hypothetical protein